MLDSRGVGGGDRSIAAEIGVLARLDRLEGCFSLIDLVNAMSSILLTCCGAWSTKKLSALSPQPAFAPITFTCAIVVASAFVITSVVVAVSYDNFLALYKLNNSFCKYANDFFVS